LALPYFRVAWAHILPYYGRKRRFQVKQGFLFIVSILILSAVSALAQQPPATAQPQTIEQKLARVFQEWERPDRPGGVVAVVDKGQVIFKRCFGLANVEYQLPAKPQTVYDVGELAEAVTGMAVAMLEDQGKVTATDLVKKYLPGLPSYADGLTIAHLVHHTSGLPDWYDLLTVAGWNDGDAITAEPIHKILERQKQLLFEPGTKSAPSRTDYVLLAELVRRVTGQSLRDWAWANIFKPLGMTRTLFRDSYRETIEDRAYSINYHSRDGFLRGADNLGAVGSLGLFTTLDDFIKWVQNLENPVVGSARVKDMMLSSGKLSGGREAGHSYGLSADTYKGLKRVYKTGSWGGFRTAFRYFPTASIAVFVFTNWDYNWNDPNAVADGAAEVCLEPLLEKPALPSVPGAAAVKRKPVKLSPAELSQYAGEFRAEGWGYLTVAQEKGALLLKAGGQVLPLISVGEGRFAFEDPNIPIVLNFSRGSDGKVSQFFFDPGNGEIIASRVERETLTGDQLQLYRGAYYCEELDARYEIVPGEGRLVLSGLRTADIVLTPENRKIFVSRNAVFPLVSFLIGDNGEVTGFRVDSDSLRHLVFKKN
jgi:CubicO group peptidase (beta-lactamase class C family)